MKIKIFTIVLVFLLSCSSAIYSQYRIGIRAGMGVADLVGSDLEKVSKRSLGAEAAFFYEREINATLGITFELLYNQKGAEYEFYPREETTVFVDYKSSYISLPLVLKAYFGRKANFYIGTGLAYSRLFDHSISHYAKEKEWEISSEPFFPYEVNNYDVSVSLGCGFEWRRFILGFRYQHGLQNIYKGVEAPAIRNHFLSASLGFVLHKKKVIRCLGGRI